MVSRSKANSIGRILCVNHSGDDYENALNVLQEWREQFVDPTRIAFECLIGDARKASLRGYVASYRLKRQESILNKLRRPNKHYKLGELDDIGGCRIIVKSMDELASLIKVLINDPHLSLGEPKVKLYQSSRE